MVKIKHFITFFLLTFTLPLAASNIFDKGIIFKEGVVHYSVSGSEYGTKTRYIKEYGKRQVLYTNTKSKFMRQNRTTDRLIHITPKWVYEIDLESNTTTKLPNLKHLLAQRFENLSKDEQKLLTKNMTLLKHRSLTNLKGAVAPNATEILGFSCHHESIQGVDTYTAKNSDLVLKTETDILGFHSKTVATKIEKKPIDYDIFILPKNLKINDNTAQMAQLEQKAEEIITYLLSDNLDKALPLNTKLSTKSKEDFQTIIQESIKVLDAL